MRKSATSAWPKKLIAYKYIKQAEDEYGIALGNIIEERLKMSASQRSNAREIRRIINDTYALVAVRSICRDEELSTETLES